MSRLSSKSACVLEMIADGHSYAQIVGQYPELKFPDIFDAAAEALSLLVPSESTVASPQGSANNPKTWADRLAEIKAKHPRAYTSWSPDEDASLVRLVGDGRTVSQIASEFKRQPSAIRSRIRKLEQAT